MRAGLSRVEWPTDWIFRSSQISRLAAFGVPPRRLSVSAEPAPGLDGQKIGQAQARRSPAAPRQWRSLADYSVMLPANTAPAIRSPRLRRPANAGRGCGGQWFGACERPARAERQRAWRSASVRACHRSTCGAWFHSARDVTKPRAHRSLGCSPGDALPARRKHQCRRATHE